MPENSINPLLPLLIKGNGPANLTESGKWKPRGADELKNISHILEVNAPNVEINSIPTVWARPLLFEMALLSKNHKLHEQVVGEWRGLLALIALFEFKGLPLSCVPIDLSVASNARNQVFFKGLSHLIPEKTLSSDTSWKHLYIILYKNKPIGMTSPTTLVATATDYSYSGIEVKWYDGQKLNNPGGNELSPAEKNNLAAWLNHLRENLANHQHAPQNQNSNIQVDADNLNDLTTQIEKFINDLNPNLTAYNPGTRNLGISGQHAGVFAYLNKPAGVPDDIEDSAVKLIPSRTPAPDEDLLVIDQRIAADWFVSPNAVSVYKAKTLNDLGIGGHPDGRNREFAGVTLTGAEVWNTSELFSKKLILIRNKANAFPGVMTQKWVTPPTHNSNPISVVMPVNKKLLEYLTPADLNDRIIFEQTPSNEIKVRLRLTLSGINGQPNDFYAEKIYSLHNQNDFEILDALPILEVFPNFKSPGWKANYIAFSADNLAATFDIEALNPVAKRSVVQMPGNGRRVILRTDDYPEAVICKRKDQELGILLLNEVEKAFNQNKNYQVGIDFGASGTCLYAAAGDTPECVEFKNLKLSVTDKDSEQTSELFDFFMPDIKVTSPFLSLFHPFHNETDPENSEAVLEGHVYYFEDKLAKNIIPNLKWSENPKYRQYIKSFLVQLCIQTAAELVKDGANSIEWKFSYPTAFFEDQADQYKDIIWVKVIEKVNELCGLKSQHAQHFSESMASARYFRTAEKAPTELGTIFIDIGSSTSDISVWQHDRPIWQTSLKYAGRELFLNYLIAKPDILEKLLGSEKVKELKTAIDAGEPEEKKWAVTDVILRKNKIGIFDQSLGNHSELPEIKQMRSYLAFGLGGLFYYLALGVKSFINAKIYKPEMPHIYAGGNGSLMFRWLTSGGQIKGNNTVQKFFSEIFTAGLNSEVRGNFSLHMSKNPKHEASHGLVKTAGKIDESETVKNVVAGESFIVQGESRNWETMLDDQMFAGGLSVPEKLVNLENYIKVFNQAASKTMIIEPIEVTSKLSRVRGSLANSLADLRKEKSNKIIVEPIFMMALKHLMEEIR